MPSEMLKSIRSYRDDKRQRRRWSQGEVPADRDWSKRKRCMREIRRFKGKNVHELRGSRYQLELSQCYKVLGECYIIVKYVSHFFQDIVHII